jgi:hypothetical protein
LVAWQTQADVFQVVLPGSLNGNFVYRRHGFVCVEGSGFIIEVGR